MKGVIFYYSATGNTELACHSIAKHISSVSFDLVNIAGNKKIDISAYEIAGFAASTDFMGPPMLVKTFIEKLPRQHNKPAFVFNTYGMFSGKTLPLLRDWAAAKGFKIIAGYSLQMPENYPPLITKGITSKHAPKQKDLDRFSAFIKELDDLLNSLPGKEIKPTVIKVGLINSLLPTSPRTKAKEDMWWKFVDGSLCTKCGICKEKCPYQAITLDPGPVFDMNRCCGCWSCFHHCPGKAIYTNKIRGKGYYPGPSETLKKKLIHD